LQKKDKDLEDLIQMKNELLNTRIDENKKDIDKINNYIDDLNSSLIDLRNDINIKNQEFESSIANIINNLSKNKVNDFYSKKSSDVKKDDDNTGLLIKAVNDNILLNSRVSQIESDQKHFKEFIAKYNLDKDNYIDNIDKNSNDIINIQKDLDYLRNEMVPSNINEDNKEKKQSGHIDLSNYVTQDMFKKINDNMRILTSSFGTTPSREEFETTVKKINSRLETIEFIQQGVTSGPRTMINSDLVQKGGDKTTYITQAQKIVLPFKEEGISKATIDEIKKLIVTTINEEIKNISLLENPKFTEIYQNISKCEDEISKNDSSIINIRNILAVSPTQNDLMLLKQDIERLSEESKKKFNEIIHNINGDDEEESEEDDNKSELAGFCIKKKIEILIGRYHDLFSKVTSVQNKNNSLNREIKEEVKQNLKNETLRVVDDFKSKLETFTSKFETELKNKIDRGGLSIFEDKLNSKIKGDLKEKLDRIELKKNNNVIKRKIDSLENKISKTLVDTIIDLQMDEAPLIMKKNANQYELCASCNQLVKKTKFMKTDRNFYKNNSISNAGKYSYRNNSNNSNIHTNLNLNMNQTNQNFYNKKLPGIGSYVQSK
jgi:ABC-type iron transport system FetAB ATPase subunit